MTKSLQCVLMTLSSAITTISRTLLHIALQKSVDSLRTVSYYLILANLSRYFNLFCDSAHLFIMFTGFCGMSLTLSWQTKRMRTRKLLLKTSYLLRLPSMPSNTPCEIKTLVSPFSCWPITLLHFHATFSLWGWFVSVAGTCMHLTSSKAWGSKVPGD